MAEEKKFVKLYEREIRALLECDDESLARIVRAVLCESLDLEPPETEKGAERGLYLTILGQVKSARELSEKRKASGSKGGRPKTKQTEANQNQTKPNDNQIDLESAESDAGEINGEPEPPKETALERRFAEFWAAYPKKVAKTAALKVWKRLKPTQELTEQMIAAIQTQKASEQWTREGGRYIPNPATWLNGGRWEDELTGGTNAENSGDHIRERSAEEWTRGFVVAE